MGICASVFCTVHCLLTPILLSFSPVIAHFLPEEERIHRTLSVIVALLGAVALTTGFRRHRRSRVLILMAAGLGSIVGAAWFGEALASHGFEVIVTMIGSSLMIAAHRINHTFCSNCECSSE
ncbi:MerC domain-containing protein [Terriglobus albidus]|uniref:MerC domain-containing protein n=1 Tax=Terriglobus albidus TaxID=1592106 RepID=UPI0021DF748C|nr:MerC domain-containing protein [Terriglobus albidus]